MSQSRKIILFLICVSMLFSSCKKEIARDANIKKNSKSKINIEVQERENVDKELLQVMAEGINGVFNPLFAMTEGDKTVSYPMFLPFMGMKRKMETDPQNSIVTSMSREGYSLEFEIDGNLNWWDGAPVTAQDVYFTLKVLLNKDYVGDARRAELFYINGAKDYHNGVSNQISGVKIIDDKHLKINFEDFQDSFYYAFDFRPIPVHYYQRATIADIKTLDSHPLGNAAFKLDSWEDGNYANLVRVDNFKFPVNLKYISIREYDKNNNIMAEMLRGNIDALNLYEKDNSLNQNEIKKNFDEESVVENEIILLRISNHNGMENIKNREDIFKSILKYEGNDNIKVTNSLIAPTNKAFVDISFKGTKKSKENKSIPINLVYENVSYIEKVAEDLKKILSDDGYIVTLNAVNPYELLKLSTKFIENGRNTLVLSKFKHGYMPDFSKEFSSLCDGKYLFKDVNLDEEIFNTIVDKKSDLKDAYKLLANDIYDQKLAIGIGSPVVRTFYRKGLKSFINTEFMDWYEFATWDIIWQ